MTTSRTPDQTMALAAGFPAATRDDWMRLVEEVLKGGDFEKRLVAHSYDGLRIDPLSTAEDWPGAGDPAGFPGLAPFTRGAQALGTAREGWDIRQRHAHPNPAEANTRILEDLERGVTSVQIVADTGDAPGGHGVFLPHVDALDRTLENVYLHMAPIALEPDGPGLIEAAQLLALYERRETPAGEARAHLNMDPLGALARKGTLNADVESVTARAAALARDVSGAFPAIRAFGADGRAWHDAGASEAQELAGALASAVAYLRAMDEAGLSIDAACGQIAFTLTADTDQFLTIAKLRAARRLWAHVAAACGAGDGPRAMELHVQTSRRMMAARDPWVNILRTTVACFAAACGGAQSISVEPFTAAIGLPTKDARRIARNIQLVLMEESGLARVVDPAGGAWSIERLTDSLCERAWAQFQEIEAAGGMAGALQSGSFTAKIAETRVARMKNIATRKDNLTGVSAFPNLAEAPVLADAADLAALNRFYEESLAARSATGEAKKALSALEAAKDAKGAATQICAAVRAGALASEIRAATAARSLAVPPLPEMRLAAPYEVLRDAAQAWKDKHGSFPQVALVNLGPLAVHTARTEFARNLFAAGGIEGVDAGAREADTAAKAFRSSGCRVAVVCSSTELYGEHGAELIAALRKAGASLVLLAGKRGELPDGAVADHYIHMGCDVLEVLQALHAHLGLKPTGTATGGAR